MSFIFRPPETCFAFSKIASFFKKISLFNAPGVSIKIVPPVILMRLSSTKAPVSSWSIVCSFFIKSDSFGTNAVNFLRYSSIDLRTGRVFFSLLLLVQRHNQIGKRSVTYSFNYGWFPSTV